MYTKRKKTFKRLLHISGLLNSYMEYVNTAKIKNEPNNTYIFKVTTIFIRLM